MAVSAQQTLDGRILDMQGDRVFRCRAGWQWLASSTLVLASLHAQIQACARDRRHVPKYLWVWLHSISACPILGAYSLSIYHYKHMC